MTIEEVEEQGKHFSVQSSRKNKSMLPVETKDYPFTHDSQSSDDQTQYEF